MAKPFAAFDVDGTIFKSSLIEKLVDACIADGVFASKPFAEVYAARRRWQLHNTEAIYQAYLALLVKTLIEQMAGVDVKWLDKVVKTMVAEHTVRKFGFPKQLIRRLHETHYIVAISGSPDLLVRPLLADLPIDAMYGSMYEIKDNRFTGNATPVADKAAILRRLMSDGRVMRAGSIALGDTISDANMLDLAETPIMFNASKTLLRYGKPRHWLQVNEVKDQITVLGFDASLHRYVESSARALLPRATRI